MTRRKVRVAIIGGLIVAALFAAYVGLQSRKPAELARAATDEPNRENSSVEPPKSAARPPNSAMDTGVETKTDAAEFKTLQLCTSASRELAITNALSDCKPFESQPQFANFYSQCLNGWMNVPNRKAAAETALKAAGCGDTSDVETRYFDATKKAARAGDADAQLCYLRGNFGALSGQSLFSDEDVEEYKRVAPQYINSAISRGDWRVVQLMTKRSFHPGEGPVTQIPDIGKPETIYRMTKLLRLGASGFYAKTLDMQVNGMIHPDLVPEAALPPDVIKNGDEWAQQTFNEHFSGVVGLTEAPTVCMASPGEVDRLPGPSVP